MSCWFNSKLQIEGLVGLSYITMWSLIVLMGCYFIYLGINDLKKEKNSIESQSKLRFLLFFTAGLAMFVVPLYWYYIIAITVDDYNLIHLYDT